jgi:hypothetical protein
MRREGVWNEVGPLPVMSTSCTPFPYHDPRSLPCPSTCPSFHLISLLPPAMCPFRSVTSTSAPSSIRCLLSPYHLHESNPFPPPHLHYTSTYNLLINHATSSTSHPVNCSAGPGGPLRRSPRPWKAESTRTVLDPKRVVIAVVGGG